VIGTNQFHDATSSVELEASVKLVFVEGTLRKSRCSQMLDVVRPDWDERWT